MEPTHERQLTQEEKDIVEYYRLQDELYNPYDVLASNGGFAEGPKIELFKPKKPYRAPTQFTGNTLQPFKKKSGA